MSIKKALLGAVLLGLAAVPANSATLFGDTVSIAVGPTVGVSQSGTVVSGPDFTIANVSFDFDFGLDGDEFQVTVNNGSFPSFAEGAGNPLTISLTGLDFSGGASLISFINLFSVFENTTFSLTSNTLVFSMTDELVNEGIVLSGKFVTTSEVPIPAALPLMAAGLGAMGFMGWRKKRKTLSA